MGSSHIKMEQLLTGEGPVHRPNFSFFFRNKNIPHYEGVTPYQAKRRREIKWKKLNELKMDMVDL